MLELPKIKSLGKLVLGEISEEKRVSIPSTTKNAVYRKAKGRCESCGMPLKMTDRGAQFHHIRKPTVKSRPSTIQFLCATCHRRYGHRKKTTTKYDVFRAETQGKVTRLESENLRSSISKVLKP